MGCWWYRVETGGGRGLRPLGAGSRVRSVDGAPPLVGDSRGIGGSQGLEGRG